MSKLNTRLVWSDDPKNKVQVDGGDRAEDQRRVKKDAPGCGGTEPVHPDPVNWIAIFRLEKGGRGGKTVTVIDQLPKQDQFLRDLCKELKSKCGSGGTYMVDGQFGKIEIQGDKRAAIKAIFAKKGIRYKGM